MDKLKKLQECKGKHLNIEELFECESCKLMYDNDRRLETIMSAINKLIIAQDNVNAYVSTCRRQLESAKNSVDQAEYRAKNLMYELEGLYATIADMLPKPDFEAMSKLGTEDK